MAAHHRTNWGLFGERIPTCRDGFTYTTLNEWLEVAKTFDIGVDPADPEYDEAAQEWAEDSLLNALASIAEANEAVQRWCEENFAA